LWEDVVKKSPEKSRAHYNLSGYYFMRGDYQKAYRHYKIAEELGYKDPMLYFNLSITAGQLGFGVESDNYYRQFKKLKSGGK
jgi:tetratricopeptide (TPR) repeat protein